MNRRHFLQAIAACLGLAQLDRLAASVHADPLLKVIPSSGEKLPAIGMGSFVSFNVGHDVEVLQQRTELLRIFFQLGGGIIDSSPIYGSSERNLGYCLENLKYVDGLFFLRQKSGPLRLRMGQLKSKRRETSGKSISSIYYRCTTCCHGKGTWKPCLK
nr:hypothetical protein [Solemya velum gill symbiont]